MKLLSLIKDISYLEKYILDDLDIKGIKSNSELVDKGDIFVAIKGENFDSHKKIDDVIEKGVFSVIGEVKPKKEWLKKVSYILVKDSRQALAEISSKWFDNPSKKIKVIGVTGTDGKTTTSTMIYSILKTAGKKVGLITSVSAIIGEKDYDTGFHVTNPEPFELQQFLRKMIDAKCEYAVIEVTSHGIKQKRIYGIDFDIAVLTNITSEHLDYHKTFEDYKNTKIRFLTSAKTVIANKDDNSFSDIENKSKKIFSYGIENKSDVNAENIIEKNKALSFEVKSINNNFQITPSFFGKYNVYNSIAAITVCLNLGIDNNFIIKSFKEFNLPSGRMQKINVDKPYDVYVDFAHTPNALTESLKILRKNTKGKLISVLGCAGERDKSKREKMGFIATKYSDISVFTAEDPRSEDVFTILSKMRNGARKNKALEFNYSLFNNFHDKFGKNKYFTVIPQRHEAIAFSLLKGASKDDTVAIFGKGHEKSLAYEKFEHPWSDEKVVKGILSNGEKISAIVMGAGKGTRMLSNTPKVLRKICGRPMISFSLENLRRSGVEDIVLVIGFKKNLVMKETAGLIKFAFQPKVLGTADAAEKGLRVINKKCDTVMVLNGDDSAFYKPSTIKDIVKSHNESKSDVTFVSLIKGDPEGLGRVVRDDNGKVSSIVEEKAASDKEKKIKEVNVGFYIFNKKWLTENIGRVEKSAVGEYYIVDLIKFALDQGKRVNVFILKDSNEWQGINTPEQLEEANQKMRKRLSEWN